MQEAIVATAFWTVSNGHVACIHTVCVYRPRLGKRCCSSSKLSEHAQDASPPKKARANSIGESTERRSSVSATPPLAAGAATATLRRSSTSSSAAGAKVTERLPTHASFGEDLAVNGKAEPEPERPAEPAADKVKKEASADAPVAEEAESTPAPAEEYDVVVSTYSCWRPWAKC